MDLPVSDAASEPSPNKSSNWYSSEPAVFRFFLRAPSSTSFFSFLVFLSFLCFFSFLSFLLFLPASDSSAASAAASACTLARSNRLVLLHVRLFVVPFALVLSVGAQPEGLAAGLDSSLYSMLSAMF